MSRTLRVLRLSLATAAVAGFWSFTPLAEAAEKCGWEVLFDGSNLDAWENGSGGKPNAGWVIKDGVLTRQKGAGYIWSKKRFDDFVLDLEFKTEGNSGVFFRTDNPKDPVQTGIEVQVLTPVANPSKHSAGALYDLQAPTKEATKAGQWNHLVVTAKGSRVEVVINGEKVVDADLDRWTEAGKNPDGTKNKFKTALKNFKREGHIGLQDHGAAVSYRNIKVKPL